jgi:hypothetical protein
MAVGAGHSGDRSITELTMLARLLAFLTVLILSVLPITTAKAENQRLLATAKTVNVLTDVIWNKSRSFNSTLELSRLDGYLNRTPLNRRYPKFSEQPDIILKLHEDVSILEAETISLTAFDPEDNGILWTEERPVVDVGNDVARLIAHFLKAVEDEKLLLENEAERRDQNAKRADADAARAREQAAQSALSTRNAREAEEAITWRVVGSTSATMYRVWVKDEHLYETSDSRNGNLIGSTHCDTVRGAVSTIGPSGIYAGTCTYDLKWVKDYGTVTPGYEVKATCSITTAEIITLFMPTRIEGWSQYLDYTPLKNTPPSCPVAGPNGKVFVYEHPSSANEGN